MLMTGLLLGRLLSFQHLKIVEITGLLFLAFALIVTPTNAAWIVSLAENEAWRILLVVSTTFLLAAIVAFGVITYSRPVRLWCERRIERRLNRELGKVP